MDKHTKKVLMVFKEVARIFCILKKPILRKNYTVNIQNLK